MPDAAARAARPSDADVLACVEVAPRAGLCTYVVTNRLRARGFAVATPLVLRRLKRLERQGAVERARSGYAVMIAWRRPAPPSPRPGRPAYAAIPLFEDGA